MNKLIKINNKIQSKYGTQYQLSDIIGKDVTITCNKHNIVKTQRLNTILYSDARICNKCYEEDRTKSRVPQISDKLQEKYPQFTFSNIEKDLKKYNQMSL